MSSLRVAMRLAVTGAFIFSAIAPVLSFDGWHQETASVLEGKTTGFDYITFDGSKNRLFLGRRKEGLQVFDIASGKVIKTIQGTQERSSNGALLIPEFDLGLSNNEDGTLTPFKLSTLEVREAIKVAKELDASYYDAATKRIFVHSEGDERGTDLIILEVPSLKPLQTIRLATKKAEHGAGDGKGNYYIAARDVEMVYQFDSKAIKFKTKFATPGCGQVTALALNIEDNRVLLGCRGNATTKPSFAVLDPTTGTITFTAEIGAGNDGVIYDPGLQRVFLANGTGANLSVFERVSADKYKLSEVLGTRHMAKTIAFDPVAKKLFSMTAESSADMSKKVKTVLAPFYPNTFFPNTFTVLTYAMTAKTSDAAPALKQPKTSTADASAAPRAAVVQASK